MADAATRQQDEIDALIDQAGPPETPANLGNIPSEPGPDLEPGTEPPVEAVPRVPRREPDPEPEPESAEPSDPVLQGKIEALERELQFFRLGQQPAAADPIPPPPQLPFQITEDDINVVLQGGPKAAQYIQAALYAVQQSTAAATEQRLAAMYQQSRQTEATSLNMREAFYGQHKELERFQEIVGVKAQEIARRMPYADARTLMDETARATREELHRRGIPFEAKPTPSRRATRLRPATGETGSGRSQPGRPTLSAVERDIFQMLGAGR